MAVPAVAAVALYAPFWAGPATLERVLEYLGRTLSETRRGLRLQRQGDLVRLVTAPETALYIDRMRGQ